MSRTISSTVLPIQRAMAGATPSAWRDGLVVEASGATASVVFLDGAVATLRVVGPAVELIAGEPVAYHPVAELLDAARLVTTARVA
ncbi:nuclease [Gryllotalpicola reticulitermitis]|uniref:Nuclease n=1 Tax=Gryllotalpicola reticulitermitis TaxID=1184153 RepID=A0ABV8Q7I3_9MICO